MLRISVKMCYCGDENFPGFNDVEKGIRKTLKDATSRCLPDLRPSLGINLIRSIADATSWKKRKPNPGNW